MPVLALPNTNSIAGYLFVALVLVAGVVGLSLCADMLGAGCEHLCCSGADRSQPLARSIRRLLSAFFSTTAATLGPLEHASRALITPGTVRVLLPAVQVAGNLRI